MTEATLHVLIDDTRDLGADVIIRKPDVAIAVLRRLLKQTARTYWDNDLGGGWELEGRNLLKQHLQDCANAGHYPEVVVVTSNSVAARDMIGTLQQYGYTQEGNEPWRHA